MRWCRRVPTRVRSGGGVVGRQSDSVASRVTHPDGQCSSGIDGLPTNTRAGGGGTADQTIAG